MQYQEQFPQPRLRT